MMAEPSRLERLVAGVLGAGLSISLMLLAFGLALTLLQFAPRLREQLARTGFDRPHGDADGARCGVGRQLRHRGRLEVLFITLRSWQSLSSA
jgi:hypothetical protein